MALVDIVETEEEAAQRKVHTGNLYRTDHWRRSTCKVLEGTQYGYAEGTPPRDQEFYRQFPSALYHSVVAATCQSYAGEMIALECSSNLLAQCVNDPRARTYLATQVLDEARHVEVFKHRLELLGRSDIEATVKKYANPKMEAFGKKVMKIVIEQRDFAAGVVGQNLALEGLALGVFDFTGEFYRELDPGYAHVLDGVIADERRHVGFGVTRVREILEEKPSLADHLSSTLSELSGDMLDMIQSLAESMADYGMDVEDVMGRVKRAHTTHWRRLGLEMVQSEREAAAPAAP